MAKGGMMRLSEVNQWAANRGSQGVPHNVGIKTQRILHRVGTELKERPPSVLAKTRRKAGAARAEKQRVAILLSKARRRGARIPKK